MASFSSVTSRHVQQAIDEYDSRGADAFLALYGFEPLAGYALVHDGAAYDPRALLGVAHRYATGRLATTEEFAADLPAAMAILRRRGFEVTEPQRAVRAAPVRAPRTSTPRARTAPARTRAAAAPEREAAICPTCSMALPATGICDYCG